MDRTHQQIERAFAPVEGENVHVTNIRESFRSLAFNVSGAARDNRERALALTKLEESFLFAREAIIRGE